MLVHCLYGQSRSVTILSSYIMHSKQLGANQAIEYIRAKHHEIFVNDGFQRQLLVYEMILSKRVVGFEIVLFIIYIIPFYSLVSSFYYPKLSKLKRNYRL